MRVAKCRMRVHLNQHTFWINIIITIIITALFDPLKVFLVRHAYLCFTSTLINDFLSYFFVKKIPLSRRVEYVMDGSMDESVSQ